MRKLRSEWNSWASHKSLINHQPDRIWYFASFVSVAKMRELGSLGLKTNSPSAMNRNDYGRNDFLSDKLCDFNGSDKALNVFNLCEGISFETFSELDVRECLEFPLPSWRWWLFFFHSLRLIQHDDRNNPFACCMTWETVSERTKGGNERSRKHIAFGISYISSLACLLLLL